MLADLRVLLEMLPEKAPRAEYRRAIIEDNLLGKPTGASRQASLNHLTDLYGLDPCLPVFRLLRTLWPLEPEGQPLLALLCAVARDPLLRESVVYIQSLLPAQVVTNPELEHWLKTRFPNRFKPTTLMSVSQNLNGSWTQAGFLHGKVRKTRIHPIVTSTTLIYALVLGYLEGTRALNLFSTLWTGLLEQELEALQGMAVQASRQGWIDYRSAGNIVEVKFDPLLTPSELELLRE